MLTGKQWMKAQQNSLEEEKIFQDIDNEVNQWEMQRRKKGSKLH